MLSPADQIKLKSLTQEVQRVLGKAKFAEFMDLHEKSEDEQDEGNEQESMGGAARDSQRANTVYPTQGK